MAGKSEREHHAYPYGTDREYLDFIRGLPSALSGQWSTWDMDKGAGRNEAAHWRTSATSGTAYKAPYSAIPLTKVEHARQHNPRRLDAFPWANRGWWEHQVNYYVNLFIATMKQKKGLK